MTAGSPALAADQPHPARASVGAEIAIARRAFRQLWIGAGACALAFGGTVASSALTYVSAFPTESTRQQLAATTSGDTGFAILLGPTSSIDTVGGYTVYKCYVFLTTIGALWALLAATRLLRGEEDGGRWQLALVGATRPGRATAVTLAAIGAAVAMIFAGTAACTFLAGRSPEVGLAGPDVVLYALSLTIPPAVFASIGALTSQLARTRRLATGLGIATFGVSFVLRMIADSGPGASWLRWATPFGWTELVAAFTVNDPRPLLPATLTVGVLCGAATMLASRRDVGDGVLASRDRSPLRPYGLRSALGLAGRLDLAVLTAWLVGAAATALVFGIIARLTTAPLPTSMSDTLQRFGVQGSFANQYFGIAFLLVATVVCLLPANQIAAAADEETSGRLVHVLIGATSRSAWLAGRLILTAAAVVIAGLVSGLFAWLGAASQGVDVSPVSMLGAGLNVVPTALVALGIGAVVLALAPRAGAPTVYAVVVWSMLVDLLASMVPAASWLGQLSLFHYMALAPADSPDLNVVALTVAIAAGLCALSILLFDRRDIQQA